MDETVYKIAIAGFLHDIGKFAERASAHRDNAGDLKAGFYIDEEFVNNNQDLYQPQFDNRYTHKHALHTAAFIDHFEKILPKQFNKGQWGLEDSFINLTAGHHKPETPLQWIIAIADRVSSGFDRAEFEDKYNKEIQVKDYKKTRLLAIFESLSTDKESKYNNLDDYKYHYPLKELSPVNIFPEKTSLNPPLSMGELRGGISDNDKASEQYRDLFFNFINSLENLLHKDNIPLWFEHFDSLFMIYTSHIPAATVGYVVPDVSLYDHSRSTSALASALYKYHKETNSMTIEAIQDYKPNKFLLISGDFYGIQDFIFTEGGSTGKASAKLLRGRSFYISLLSELAADMLCRELGLPVSSILLNAAGKFTILAHNTESVKQKVKAIEDKVNDWLINHFFAQASMGFSILEASCNDFVIGNFADLWQRLSQAVNSKKYSKFDLLKHGGCVKDYLDSFDNRLGICPFCEKRPATNGAFIKDTASCTICRDHAYLGENLVKETRLAITTINADIEREKLLEPIFGEYQLSFKVTGKLNQLSNDNTLLKYWDIEISDKGEIAKDITAKFINGYVPIYKEEELTDEAMDRILTGKKSDKSKEELFDSMEVGIPKTFAYIAKTALTAHGDIRKSSDTEQNLPTENTQDDKVSKAKIKYKGIEALGILKADVDNLGFTICLWYEKRKIYTLKTCDYE